MPTPALSVVVPTKDRPEFLLRTVRSILSQEFQDLEVVIVDNSDSDESRLAIEGMRDPRLRLIRTGGLNMPENWEAALRAGCGRFVMMSNDKTELRNGAAGRIVSELDAFESPFLTWVIGAASAEPIPPTAVRKIQNQEVLGFATECRIDLYQRFAPRGTNCAVARPYLQECFARHGRLCRPISPDYTLSALLLANTEFSTHLSVSLGSVMTLAPSNTHVMQDAPARDGRYYSTLGLREEEILASVPLKTFLINNVLLNDILESLRGAGLAVPKIVLKEYVLMLLSDLLILKREDRPWRMQREELRQWIAARGSGFFAVLILHALCRFREGWPNRKLRMRENLPAVLSALRMLSFPKWTL